MMLMTLALLSTKREPTLLRLRPFRLRLFYLCRLRLGLLHCRSPTRILDIVPRHIEEQWLLFPPECKGSRLCDTASRAHEFRAYLCRAELRMGQLQQPLAPKKLRAASTSHSTASQSPSDDRGCPRCHCTTWVPVSLDRFLLHRSMPVDGQRLPNPSNGEYLQSRVRHDLFLGK